MVQTHALGCLTEGARELGYLPSNSCQTLAAPAKYSFPEILAYPTYEQSGLPF